MRYAIAIHSAVAAYPSATSHTPSGIAVSTFAARFRDALKSLHDHQWPGILTPTLFHKFNDCYEDLIVAERQGFVLTGSKEVIKNHLEITSEDAPNYHQLTIRSFTPRLVEALAMVCDKKLLHHSQLPVKFIGAIDPDLISRLESELDIAFTQTNDGYTLL